METSTLLILVIIIGLVTMSIYLQYKARQILNVQVHLS